MPWRPKKTIAQAGDYIQLLGPRNKSFFFVLESQAKLHTNYGFLEHDDLIGQPWGSQVYSHSGNRFLLLQPRLGDLLLKTKRTTQIMFPKDIGFLLLTLGLGPGWRVIEAGTGSGALTTALAYSVGSEGQVYSYDLRPEMQELARDNLAKLKLGDRVCFHTRDIQDGFLETEVDAVLLDLPEPEAFLPQCRQALMSGGFFAAILPTANQVSSLVAALREHHFDSIEICETMLRYYKPVPQRLRPKDRMVGHTGYLVLARMILPVDAA